MSVGDKVIITHSPYSSVREGTVATIASIRKKTEMTESWRLLTFTLYELSGLPHRLFYRSETKPIKE